MNAASLPGMTVTEFIQNALLEDIGDGDHTSLSTIDEHAQGHGIVRVKQDGIIAGLVVADNILTTVDPLINVNVLATEGKVVQKGEIVMTADGSIRSLLKSERLLLNCMQRMSGIATLTRNYVQAIEGTRARILDTGKTTPNFRPFEKWAVTLGGGTNHRFGLFDMILIKDNHVDGAGGIRNAILKANDYLKKTGKKLPIEIETRNLNEVRQVMETGNVDRIMLDNFHPDLIREALIIINKKYETEASGGINLENIRSYAETGVDFISIGALTHTFNSLDISMKVSIV